MDEIGSYFSNNDINSDGNSLNSIDRDYNIIKLMNNQAFLVKMNSYYYLIKK